MSKKKSTTKEKAGHVVSSALTKKQRETVAAEVAASAPKAGPSSAPATSPASSPAPKAASLPALQASLAEGAYMPDKRQRLAKVQFWNRYEDVTGLPVDGQIAAQLTGEPRVKDWFNDPSFKNWFLNKDENKELLEYAFQVGLSRCLDSLSSPDLSDKDLINMMKIIGHLADKEPIKAKEVKYLDAQLKDVDEAKLDSMIAALSKKLPGGST